ncbi:MAG: hypothetical protein B6247_24970 [Candidatus Parabeggiatoa sp. nov. 2]|nr:MAG: hypothetical protein B6247_24970 [Beggiatoa sp. 4572_84]
MSSQSRTYLLDERFSDVGIGYVYKPSSPYRHYWVIIFGGGQPQAGYTEMRREVTTQEWQTAQSLLERLNSRGGIQFASGGNPLLDEFPKSHLSARRAIQRRRHWLCLQAIQSLPSLLGYYFWWQLLV